MGLFPNTALDTFVQNVAEPPVKKVNNSRAILNFLNQGAGTFWANGAKPVLGNSPEITYYSRNPQSWSKIITCVAEIASSSIITPKSS